MKLRYSPRALGDLARIGDYLIERSPKGALSVEASIRKTIDIVVAFPRAGRVVEQRLNVRVMPVGRHYLLSTLCGATKLSYFMSATAHANRLIHGNFDGLAV